MRREVRWRVWGCRRGRAEEPKEEVDVVAGLREEGGRGCGLFAPVAATTLSVGDMSVYRKEDVPDVAVAEVPPANGFAVLDAQDIPDHLLVSYKMS